MTDDEIQAVLLAHRRGFGSSGYVTTPVEDVENAGADVDEVGRWVNANGGQRYTPEAPQSTGLRPGGPAPRRAGEPVFEVPRAAFDAALISADAERP